MCRHQSSNEKVVYLFNSAYRGTYAHNLFKIMASQNGLHATLRYDIQKNVPHELRNPLNFKMLEDCPCFIVFINRYYDKNYQFLPIRQATIHKIYTDSGYLFVNVRLNDYVSLRGDVEAFTTLLSDRLESDNIPSLKDSNPEITTDGNYIVHSDKSINDVLILNNESWIKSVSYISKTKAFNEKTTFIKINFCELSKDNELTPMRPDKKGMISVSPHTNYIIDATYFDSTLGKGKFSFNLDFQNPLGGMQRKIYCTSKVDNFSIPVSSGKYVSISETPCSINISQVENDIEHCFLTIPCKITPIWKDWVVVILLIITLLSAASAELLHSHDFWQVLSLTVKWLASLILIVYAGMKVF